MTPNVWYCIFKEALLIGLREFPLPKIFVLSIFQNIYKVVDANCGRRLFKLANQNAESDSLELCLKREHTLLRFPHSNERAAHGAEVTVMLSKSWH